MFLLDASQSIPRELRQVGARLRHRGVEEAPQGRPGRGDRLRQEPERRDPAGADARSTCCGIESTVDPEYTDLAAAIKLALATFPEDTARRIVILSDGNENRGNALEQALAAKNLGVQIDVLPIEYFYDREVLVEKVSIPPDVKKGETVNINVVIRASEPTRGTLQIFQKADNYRAPAPGNEKPAAGRARARGERLDAQAADHQAELLHVHRRVHPRQGQRRPAGRSTTSPRGSPTPGARPRSC